ncbi:uncharacterized protein N7479_003845 [Penicillium vulpinum]|uniref:uncharacterized protein n=1 Tax=Penicillium vulpinum TaxID=29845 RepID=UPI002547504F|nr:uncharacterized protein N7479_003845 [Penicillium vulpinum]KAJ5963969.1 hypothetical protein N7479_003845 [Penicillium vulpinum]
MTEAQFPLETTSWSMETLGDSYMGQHDELGPGPFIATDFPLTMQDALDPSWAVEQFGWIDGYPVKSTAFQPYPQIWYEAGLVRQDCGGVKADTTSFSLNQSIPFQSTENVPIHSRPDLQLATQRALFMTPPSNTLAFPFPGSPSSDLHGSPGPSHASSSGWEGEAEHLEDAQYTQFDFGPSGLDAQYQAHGQPHSVSSPHRRYSRTDEECLTPLEMPDGSTRMTSNWLPVDPDAGFAIGSAMMMNEDMPAFQDVKHAFFPSDPAAWSYDP